MATLGLGFYGFTDYLTALFPTLFGIILMMAGAVSVSRPELNALAMHFAVLASLVAAILGFATALFGTWTTTTSLIEQMLMSAIATTHLYACVASYYFGKAKFPGDTQTCGVDELEVAKQGQESRSSFGRSNLSRLLRHIRAELVLIHAGQPRSSGALEGEVHCKV